MNEKRAKEKKDLALIDSLFQETLRLEEELNLATMSSLNNKGLASLGGANIDPKITEVSKSLLRLDEEELAPILNRLTDSMLLQLYEATNGVQREKLLRSLEPAKSAVLLKRVMS